jgi:hypothetical protein
LERALSDPPSRADHAAGEAGPDQHAEPDHDHGLDQRDDRQLDQAAGDEGLAPDRGDQEAVDHAPVEVLDHAHAGPAAGDGGLEAGDVGGGLEHGPEQQQPDDGLYQGDRDPPGLAGQLAQVAHGHEPGMGQGGAHWETSSATLAKLRPVCRR